MSDSVDASVEPPSVSIPKNVDLVIKHARLQILLGIFEVPCSLRIAWMT